MKKIDLDQLEFEETSSKNKFYSIIESILFVSGEPVELSTIAQVLQCSQEFTRKIIEEMTSKYKSEDRGIQIINSGNSYGLVTKPANSIYVEKLLGTNLRQNLSQAAVETLAIIAYKQPVTRAIIDEIRGVKSERAVSTLIEKKIIRESGRLDVPGRPILYSTTEEFLKYFGLESIKELPGLDSFFEEI
ncbi:MAG: SMC-Scp complex subunit ScpB [Solirubrobacterales bacterium]